MIKKDMDNRVVFAAVVAVLYLFFGLMQIVAGIGYESGLNEALFVPADIMGGFMLMVVGFIFLFGVKELNSGVGEGVAYLYVGIVITLVLAGIYLLIMGSDALSAYGLGSEDFDGWTPLDDLKPVIYLAVLPFLGFLKWRGRFTLG